MKICTIEDCTRENLSRGYCSKHYYSLRRTGELEMLPKLKQKRSCSIDECNSPVMSRGWCNKHYVRWSHKGDPLDAGQRAIGPYRLMIDLYLQQDWAHLMQEIEDRSLRTRKEGIDSDCWDWAGPKQREGYALIRASIDLTTYAFLVHRLSLSAKIGRSLHKKMQAHHKCANRACVNPEHLEEITQSKNIGEMQARKYFLARIKELEEVVREFDPSHPLLP